MSSVESIVAHFERVALKEANNINSEALQQAEQTFINSLTAAINSGEISLEAVLEHFAKRLVMDKLS